MIFNSNKNKKQQGSKWEIAKTTPPLTGKDAEFAKEMEESHWSRKRGGKQQQ